MEDWDVDVVNYSTTTSSGANSFIINPALDDIKKYCQSFCLVREECTKDCPLYKHKS